MLRLYSGSCLGSVYSLRLITVGVNHVNMHVMHVTRRKHEHPTETRVSRFQKSRPCGTLPTHQQPCPYCARSQTLKALHVLHPHCIPVFPLVTFGGVGNSPLGRHVGLGIISHAQMTWLFQAQPLPDTVSNTYRRTPLVLNPQNSQPPFNTVFWVILLPWTLNAKCQTLKTTLLRTPVT